MIKKLLMIASCISLQLNAQTKKVDFVKKLNESKVDVMVAGKHFTSLIFPADMEKPVLYPINAANGQTVTRGFPIAPRDGERTDHPHHVGLWLNYESVNGLDFWNNSYAIPADRKVKYGWIRNLKVGKIASGQREGRLSYSANWENQAQKALLKEETTLIFSGTDNERTIDRITTLTAQKDTVYFKDVKDGMLGLRVTKELEMPSDKVEEFTDSKGNRTKVSASGNGANGNYLTNVGKKGNDVWGTRGNWCVMHGKKAGEALSVSVIDHPKNPGYPTYWHARDYGLFAANPLGQKVFSNGKENLNLTLSPGQSVTFRYRIIITSGDEVTPQRLNEQAIAFGK
ncbi:MAG: hypothetical protein EOP48_21475 [Sphingobacteriales bacterium]|nr:MAG: hypothetical protein EOP48_21475 [Sphingobacteriales bacterium]